MVMGGVVGKDIVTIEGLSSHSDHPVQQAWKAGNVPQCGYCQSGPDHAGGGLVAGQAQAHGPGHRRRHTGQYLPVWDLSTHPQAIKLAAGVQA